MKKILSFFVFISITFTFLGLSSCQKSFSVPAPVDAKLSQTVDVKDGETYDLTAAPVKKIIAGQEQMLIAYNGMLPGPTIRVKQGSTIKILFRNNTNLPDTLHSHGVRLDNASDGIPYVTQKPVMPGETFLYTVHFPDVGVFWYHPHMSEPEKQESGLFGNFIVLPDEKNQWQDIVDQEVPLMFHDILLDRDQKLLSFHTASQFTLMGRYGNKLMTNWDENYTLQIKKGETVRFYMTNTANARPFNIVIDGAKMKRVGGDNGAYEHETWEKSIVLGPSERSILEARFDTVGTFAIKNQIPSGDTTFGNIVVTDDPAFQSKGSQKQFETLHSYSNTSASIDPFRKSFKKSPDKDITLSLTMKGMMAGHMQMMRDTVTKPLETGKGVVGIEWDAGDSMMQMMNQMSDMKNVSWKIIDNFTKQENMMINWDFQKGDMVKIHIFNDPNSLHPMQHPIHLHGERFLVLDTDGKKNDNLVWKDTVLVPTGSSVDILVDMSNPGDWMGHCHISAHLENGMMFNFSVR